MAARYAEARRERRLVELANGLVLKALRVRTGKALGASMGASAVLCACSLLVPLDSYTEGNGTDPVDASRLGDADDRPDAASSSGAPDSSDRRDGSSAETSTDAAGDGSPEDDDPYRLVVLATNPVGYWRLADRTGVTAVDEIGNAHPGTYYGGYELDVPGVRPAARAVFFNGSSACVSMGDYFAFTGGVAFSVEAWIRTGGPGAVQRVVSTEGSETEERNGYGLGINSVGDGFFEGWRSDQDASSVFIMGAYTNTSAGPNVTHVQWHHLVGTFEPDAEQIWLDGVLRNRTSQSDLPLLGSHNFTIGCSGSGSGTVYKPFLGEIADVAVYDRVLTEVEITQHFQVGNPP